jgi:flagellar biosynthesis/type III secretory pathway M-ring protein FliF/YscJ
MSDDECRAVEVDGQVVKVRGLHPMTAEEISAVEDVVRAAVALQAKRWDAMTPEQQRAETARRERAAARLRRIRARFAEVSGAGS